MKQPTGVQYSGHEESRKKMGGPHIHPGIGRLRPTISPAASPMSMPARSPAANPMSMPARSPAANPMSMPARSPAANPMSMPARSPAANPMSMPARSPAASYEMHRLLQPARSPGAGPMSRIPRIQKDGERGPIGRGFSAKIDPEDSTESSDSETEPLRQAPVAQSGDDAMLNRGVVGEAETMEESITIVRPASPKLVQTDFWDDFISQPLTGSTEPGMREDL